MQVATAAAQVPVSLPNAGGGRGTTISIPVTVGDLSGRDVMGYEFEVTYDPAIISITALETSGTMSAGAFAAGNSPAPGRFRAAAITGSAFQGGGTLARLRVELLQYGTSALEWDSFSFDLASVAVTLTDGGVVVSNLAPAFESNPPLKARVGAPYAYTPQVNDPEGDATTLSAPTLPAWLEATTDEDGAFTITGTPANTDVGSHGVVLRVQDGLGNSAEQAFAITVALNRAPQAVPDTFAVDEDATTLLDVLANDTDPDGDVLSLLRVEAPTRGTAVPTQEGRISYTPPPGFVGHDSLRYTATDGVDTARAVVRIEVRATNDAPSAPAMVLPAGGVSVTGDPGDQLNVAWRAATDPDGDVVRYRWQLSTTQAFDAGALVLDVETDTDTTLAVTYGELAARMDAQGVVPGGSVTWYHRAVASDGEASTSGPAASLPLVRGALTTSHAPGSTPDRFVLAQNYPNPFNPVTVIRYAVPTGGDVRLQVFNALGQEVRRLVEGRQESGWHEVAFEAGDLPAGSYFYTVSSGGTRLTRAMLLLK